jgi:hypothetical protein
MSDVPGDDVPEYPEDDPEGDRRPYLDAPEHVDIKDLDDDELT